MVLACEDGLKEMNPAFDLVKISNDYTSIELSKLTSLSKPKERLRNDQEKKEEISPSREEYYYLLLGTVEGNLYILDIYPFLKAQNLDKCIIRQEKREFSKVKRFESIAASNHVQSYMNHLSIRPNMRNVYSLHHSFLIQKHDRIHSSSLNIIKILPNTFNTLLTSSSDAKIMLWSSKWEVLGQIDLHGKGEEVSEWKFAFDWLGELVKGIEDAVEIVEGIEEAEYSESKKKELINDELVRGIKNFWGTGNIKGSTKEDNESPQEKDMKKKLYKLESRYFLPNFNPIQKSKQSQKTSMKVISQPYLLSQSPRSHKSGFPQDKSKYNIHSPRTIDDQRSLRRTLHLNRNAVISKTENKNLSRTAIKTLKQDSIVHMNLENENQSQPPFNLVEYSPKSRLNPPKISLSQTRRYGDSRMHLHANINTSINEMLFKDLNQNATLLNISNAKHFADSRNMLEDLKDDHSKENNILIEDENENKLQNNIKLIFEKIEKEIILKKKISEAKTPVHSSTINNLGKTNSSSRYIVKSSSRTIKVGDKSGVKRHNNTSVKKRLISNAEESNTSFFHTPISFGALRKTNGIFASSEAASKRMNNTTINLQNASIIDSRGTITSSRFVDGNTTVRDNEGLKSEAIKSIMYFSF